MSIRWEFVLVATLLVAMIAVPTAAGLLRWARLREAKGRTEDRNTEDD